MQKQAKATKVLSVLEKVGRREIQKTVLAKDPWCVGIFCQPKRPKCHK